VVELTPQQRAILECEADEVFVTAAAGSGKTALLVEKYLRALLDERAPMERIVTVTFTRKAAAEMRERIRGRLLALGITDLAWAVDDAPIGTIHSLCTRLLRARVVEAGVDPVFRVLDEEQARILSFEAMEAAWNGLVATASTGELEMLSRHRHALRSDIPKAWNHLRQAGVAVPSLGPPDPGDLEADRSVFAGALAEFSAQVDHGAGLKGRAEANWERLVRCEQWLPGARPEWDDIERAGDFSPNLNCGALKPVFLAFKEELLRFRGSLGRHYLARLQVLADRLMAGYDREYAESKSALGALDFSDLEIEADRLLNGRSGGSDSADHVLVDEFQDTNTLQCRILDNLGARRKLTVGDRYQSIYRFRGAEVEVFDERQVDVERRAGVVPPGSDSPASAVHSLTVNFRSTEPLLRTFNRIFGHEEWWGDRFPALSHPDSESIPAEPELRPSVEVIVVDPDLQVEEECTDDQGIEASVPAKRSPGPEALAVADRVVGLLTEGRRKREIVVLIRAFTHVDEFEEALRARGIDTYVVQGRGFFRSEEIADVLELLNVLVNPHDDRSLFSVLRSPLMGLPDDVAYLLRVAADEKGGRFLWDAIRGGAPADMSPQYAEPLARFEASVSRLRSRLGAPGLASLIEAAVEEFDYDLVVLRAAHGRRRLANLRKLMRLAEEFEAVEGPDLAGFVRHIRHREDIGGERESSAPTLAEEEDVVRIMTIHKAKGLEFPVVIIPGMGSSGPASDRASIRATKGGTTLRATVGRDAVTLGPYDSVKEMDRQQAIEEEKRLYYVGCTRAEELLILFGAAKEGCTPADQTPLSRVLRALGDPDVSPGAEPAPVADLAGAATVKAVRSSAGDAPDPDGSPPREDEQACPAPGLLHLPRIGTPVTRVSFSAIEQYAECPRRYYLERVLGFDPDLFGSLEANGPPDGGGSDGGAVGRAVGTIVHGILEKVGLGEPPPPSDLRQKVEESASALGYDLGSEHLERAATLVSAYWESPVPRWVAAGDRTAREQAFLFAHRSLTVSGVLDLLVETGREWTVVDFKTNRLEDRTLEAAAAHYSLQSRLYGLAGLLFGAERVRVAFLFLERPESPVVATYRQEDMPILRAALDESLEGLLIGDFSSKGEYCRQCVMQGLCGALEGPGRPVDPLNAIV
jgi:ATP-dependent helicase/nuclease subunit A